MDRIPSLFMTETRPISFCTSHSLTHEKASPLVDCMAAMLDMRRPEDLTRAPLRPDSVRKLAKGLYNVRVRSRPISRIGAD